MPEGSGRMKGLEWTEMDKLENDKSKAICKHCDYIVSAKIERVLAHLKKCNKRKMKNQAQEHLEEEAAEQNTITLDSDSESITSSVSSVSLPRQPSTSSSSASQSSIECTRNPSIKRQKLMDHYAVRTSSDYKDELDL